MPPRGRVDRRRHPIDVALVGSARTATWRSTIRRPISRPSALTSWSSWTRPAAGNNLARAGSPRFADVPRRAISMSIRQIMKSRAIVCSVPDRRKAEAVRAAIEGAVTPLVPASILQQHPHATAVPGPAGRVAALTSLATSRPHDKS